MKRALAISILFNLIMLAVTGFLFVRHSSLWRTTTVHIPQEEQFRIPHGSDDGPLKGGVIGCELSADPQSVATKVLERRQNSDPMFEVDLYVTEKESIGSVVEFLKALSNSGVTSGVRVAVSTATGPVTFEQFNTRPLRAFDDIQSFKDLLNGKTEQDGGGQPATRPESK